MKIARSSTGRQAVVVFDHAFHGRTLLAMTMTAKAMPYKRGSARSPRGVPDADGVPLPVPNGSAPDGAATGLDEAHLMDKQIGGDRIAAIVIEPIQGEGGFVVPAGGFVSGLATYAREHGIVFVADEIQSGFGRTGRMFGIEHEGVEPDLITTAKSLAGGLPLAAVTGRAEIMDGVHPGGLGGTYGGNPVACAAALAVLDQMEQEDLPGRAARLEPLILGRLREMQERFALIGEVRGRGGHVRDRAGAGPRDEGARTGRDRSRARGVPEAGRGPAEVRDLRQRAPVPAPADHRRGAAQRGARDARTKRSARGPANRRARPNRPDPLLPSTHE